MSGYICEMVNPVDNSFAADSRDKDGSRVVIFDAKRALKVYIPFAHIVQIEAVKDARDGTERSVMTLTSGLRYIAARAALTICQDMK